MHIKSEGEDYKHGVLETPLLSQRSSATVGSDISAATKWSAKTTRDPHQRGKTELPQALGNKLEKIEEDGEITHRMDAQGQYHNIEEETERSFSIHHSDFDEDELEE